MTRKPPRGNVNTTTGPAPIATLGRWVRDAAHGLRVRRNARSAQNGRVDATAHANGIEDDAISRRDDGATAKTENDVDDTARRDTDALRALRIEAGHASQLSVVQEKETRSDPNSNFP